jgi:flagellar basal-body rod protein FlgG
LDSAIFTALFGALSNEHRMNSIANNLANANTTGYKRDMLAFRDTFALYAHDQIMEAQGYVRQEKLFPEPEHLARPRLAYAKTDFAQGSLKLTGAPFDVAITGEGFFKVRTPVGEFYTRNGHFRLTGEGMLINEQGFPVLGDGAEITIPAGIKNITIAESGEIYGDGELVGQLGIVNVDDPSRLEKLGGNMYRARSGSGVEEVEASGFLSQGYLEVSNVNPVYEMVNRIEAQRQFEAYTKVMQAAESLDKTSYTKTGKAR